MKPLARGQLSHIDTEGAMEKRQQLPLLGYISFLSGPLTGKRYQLLTSDLLIGNEQHCDIVVPDPTLAPQQVQLTWDNWQWSIKNLAPDNQISVNRGAVQQGPIKHNDVISLSEHTAFVLLVEALNVTESPGGPHTEEYAQQLLPEGIPYLRIIDVDKTQRTFVLTKQSLSVGRDPSNDIVLSSPTVSHYHLHIVKEENQYVCYHPHPSTGKTAHGIVLGTFVYRGNEQVRVPLKHNTTIRIMCAGGTFIDLIYDDGTGLHSDGDQVERRLLPIPLEAQRITIGRAAKNTIVLKEPHVSFYHAYLERTEDGYQIVDLGTTNRTYVNSQPISRHLLKEGEKVQIGLYEFTYTKTHLIPRYN